MPKFFINLEFSCFVCTSKLRFPRYFRVNTSARSRPFEPEFAFEPRNRARVSHRDSHRAAASPAAAQRAS
ncbi:hypothetical protein L596_015475 [Steinernema carpocapsae]|uniref:Uncharacterized protein n=1 Tax=Steinernema carpocapsae TaxID=34508 RepID=A0A4U5NFP8_STECR|nr:hypothetical protein L596_015475 [Steinernema carpocapsae]